MHTIIEWVNGKCAALPFDGTPTKETAEKIARLWVSPNNGKVARVSFFESGHEIANYEMKL